MDHERPPKDTVMLTLVLQAVLQKRKLVDDQRLEQNCARNWKAPGSAEIGLEPGTAAQIASTSDVGPPINALFRSKILNEESPGVIGTGFPCTVIPENMRKRVAMHWMVPHL